MPLLMRLFYPWADGVIAISQGVREDLLKIVRMPEEKVKVVYNPSITPEIFAKADEPLGHPWFGPGEPPVIPGVGRLTAQKDFPTLIRAFAMVPNKRSARLMILGEVENRHELDRLVGEMGLETDVEISGFLNNPYKYIKRAAVFVLSSRFEGLSNVLIEAMSLGTPVISTDCTSGPGEILEYGRRGLLVPVSDIEAMAKAIVVTLQGNRINPVNEFSAFVLDNVLNKYAEVLEIDMYS